MRVLCLDCDLGLDDAQHASFEASMSLYDYDVVFWDPAASLQGISGHTTHYQGRKSLQEHNSARLMNAVTRRNREFKEFLEMGRCLVVFTPGDTEVYVDTGVREHSGTGRNRVTTRIVKLFDIMTAIPFKLNRRPATGVEIEATSDTIAPLLRQTRGSWVYRSVLEPHETLKALLRVKGTKKMVGGTVTVQGGRGRLILLPELLLDFDEEVDQDEDEEEEEDGQQAENENVLAESDGEPAGAVEAATAQDPVTLDEDQGGAPPATDSDEAWPADLLLRWVESLMIEPDASLPGWTESYRFSTEVERLARQLEVEGEVSALQKQLDKLEAAQIQDEKWKTLVAASGSSLEARVGEAFELFGFQFSEVEPGRSDLRGSYDGQLVVVE